MKKIIAFILTIVLCLAAVSSLAASVQVTGIKLNATKLTLARRSYYQLEATITPSNATDKEVNWSSSDESVVYVDDDGYLGAFAAGTAVVTARTNNGKTAKVTITVTDTGSTAARPTPSTRTVPVDSVKITDGNFSMSVGATRTLNLKVVPSDAVGYSVTWSSSNTKVASVDAFGKVTAKATGSTKITIKTSNGKSCTVKVKVKAPVMSGVKVSKDGTVSWNEIPGAIRYEVRWGKAYASGWNYERNILACSYTVPESKMAVGTKYTYQVKAYYLDGGKVKETGWSSRIRQDLYSGIPSVNVNKVGNQIVVSWTRPRFAPYFNVLIKLDEYRSGKVYVNKMDMASTQVTIPASYFSGFGSSVKLSITVVAHGRTNKRYCGTYQKTVKVNLR